MNYEMCSECNGVISPTSNVCPSCGFEYESSPDDRAEATVSGDVELLFEEDFSLDIANIFLDVSPMHQNAINTVFGNAENLAKVAPSVYQAIQAMSGETHLVANIPEDIQKMINDGVLKLMQGKDGSTTADVVYTSGTKKGRVYKKIRLDEQSFTPDLASALNDFSVQMQMAQIMQGIETIQKQVNQVIVGQQDDRLALFDSCMLQFQQAELIKSPQLKTSKYLDILQTATTAKTSLMRSVARDLLFFAERENNSIVQSLFDFNADKLAAEHMSNLRCCISIITQATAIEAQAYMRLGERDAAIVSLKQYGYFINANSLDNKETLLYLNSWDANNDNKLPTYIQDVNSRIMALPSPISASKS